MIKKSVRKLHTHKFITEITKDKHSKLMEGLNIGHMRKLEKIFKENPKLEQEIIQKLKQNKLTKAQLTKLLK